MFTAMMLFMVILHIQTNPLSIRQQRRAKGGSQMKFFRKMDEREILRSRQGMIFGFFVYIFATGSQYFYFTLTDQSLFTPLTLFLSGLVGSFAFEAVLKLKKKNA